MKPLTNIKRREQIMDYRKRNPDKVKLWAKQYRDSHKQQQKEWRKKYNELNPDKEREHGKQVRERQRLKLFDILGHKCIRCGYSDKRALHFDHINGGGNKMLRSKGIYSMRKWYIDNPDIAKNELQTLCANCNYIKKQEKYEV